MDARLLMSGMTEGGEMVRPPSAGVRPIRCGQTGHEWFWVLLLHTKVALLETHQLIVAPFVTRQATSSTSRAKPGNTDRRLEAI